MEADGELVRRLRSWILAGTAQQGLSAADLDPQLTYEDGMFRIAAPDAAGWVSGDFMGLDGVSLIAEVVGEGSLCVVVRGRDPVTNMWHQCAWVFETRDNTVCRVVRTSSGGLPPRHYDGTIPLREVGR
jgi:hypothetical protein